ncbi:uncharacterized protein CIMG_12499 [Coccidioides immitis RS]|uniref:Uncharacterized protein n=4 Tax=Coccidioides immitis TaxID=5501 RepID=A0A0D8JVC3_COCIM|nr:uncharacterized protein CIMG_12499 [Coccidioides immitis RS]KJF61247.1 hypothetical protein CIMG_12499 [Coccidioides immitis RS]KMP09404.1 hypothetical protein CIRG_09574 [Coccidioides immitis RMSCC 2394]KMU75337.1 hypothetical protein CISG_04756 [Coccidioides immitis RMSCC 3703]KMU88493.1 hypothetical protein CIHG_06293 [Coccidioides immitis H538.4]
MSSSNFAFCAIYKSYLPIKTAISGLLLWYRPFWVFWPNCRHVFRASLTPPRGVKVEKAHLLAQKKNCCNSSSVLQKGLASQRVDSEPPFSSPTNENLEDFPAERIEGGDVLIHVFGEVVPVDNELEPDTVLAAQVCGAHHVWEMRPFSTRKDVLRCEMR